MLGKRPRQMRRTVSVSMLGPGSSTTPPECPKDKQKPHLEMPACYNTQRQEVVSGNFPVSKPGKEEIESGAYYAASVLPFSHSESRPWEGKETEAVGLSIVAALHADTKMEAKDNRDKAFSAVVSHRPVYRNNFLPSVRQSLASPLPRKQLQYQDMQMQAPASSHRKSLSGSPKNENVFVPPATHFLETCCYCRRRLSHGRDIYMYRGDKAFCSEQCRDQQISIDERKEKYFLAALRMRTAAQPVHSSSQRSRALVTSTAAG